MKLLLPTTLSLLILQQQQEAAEGFVATCNKYKLAPEKTFTCHSRHLQRLVVLRESSSSSSDDQHLFDDDDDSDESKEIEAARARLIAFMAKSSSDVGEITNNNQIEEEEESSSSMSRGGNEKKTKKTKKRLTAAARERREKEISLIYKLSLSDEPLTDLWSLWFEERGYTGATKLMASQELVNNVDRKSWKAAEDTLKELIDEHGRDYWVEPLNRLATLYYMQGRFQESVDLCLEVLDVKPWHFGALSGIVMCYAELGDLTNAKLWASRRLPPLEAKERRKEWVERSVEEAYRTFNRQKLESFVVADESMPGLRTNKDSSSSTSFTIQSDQIVDDDDAWQ